MSTETFKLTYTNAFKIGLNLPEYKKWDIIKTAGRSSEGIVIRVKNDEGHYTRSVQYTIHPYKRFNKKWKSWLWIKWLRLKVSIGDLYKN